MIVARSSARLEQFFAGRKQQDSERGSTDTRAEIVCVGWVTDRTAIVQVRSPYIGSVADGWVKSFDPSLRRDENGELEYRIAIVHGATC